MDTAKATTAAVIIDPRDVPDEEYQTACSVLASRFALPSPTRFLKPSTRMEKGGGRAMRVSGIGGDVLEARAL
jgi:alpha-D-ribose 1-methylphosphonate 5-phosphate C-P lyase